MVAVADSISADDGYLVKGIAGGVPRRKGLLFEERSGPAFSHRLGRLVNVLQVVDKQNNRYRKLVMDPLTGEVIRDADEPLSAHQGYGDAKRGVSVVKPKKGPE